MCSQPLLVSSLLAPHRVSGTRAYARDMSDRPPSPHHGDVDKRRERSGPAAGSTALKQQVPPREKGEEDASRQHREHTGSWRA